MTDAMQDVHRHSYMYTLIRHDNTIVRTLVCPWAVDCGDHLPSRKFLNRLRLCIFFTLKILTFSVVKDKGCEIFDILFPI